MSKMPITPPGGRTPLSNGVAFSSPSQTLAQPVARGLSAGSNTGTHSPAYMRFRDRYENVGWLGRVFLSFKHLLHKRRMHATFARKIETGLSIATLAFASGLTAYGLHENHEAFKRERLRDMEHDLRLGANFIAHDVEEFIYEARRDLRLLAEMPHMQKMILENLKWKKGRNGYCAFKGFARTHYDQIGSLYLIDKDGIVLEREPFLKGRIGTSYRGKPGVEHVLKHHVSYVSEPFRSAKGEAMLSVIEPVFSDGTFIGMVRWKMPLKSLGDQLVQQVKIGEHGYATLATDEGAVLEHPNREHVGKNLRMLWGRLKILDTILRGDEGSAPDIFDGFLKETSFYAWTYASVTSKPTGTAGITLKHDGKGSTYFLEQRARLIARELDRKIPRLQQLLDTEYLVALVQEMQRKYPDIVELTIHGPASAEDSTLIHRASSNPAIKCGLIHTQDLRAIKENRYNIRHVGRHIVDVTVPIHSNTKLWPVITVQPLSEITGPIQKHQNKTLLYGAFLFLIFGASGLALYRGRKKRAVAEAEAHNLRQLAMASDEVRASEALLRSVFEEAHSGMSVSELDGRFIRVNEALARMLGYSVEELMSKTFQEIIVPDDLQENRKLLQQLTAGEIDSFQMEKKFLHKDGTEIPAIVNVAMIRDADGNPKHLIAQASDLREHLQLEEALRMQDKTEALAVLAGGIAHDYNNTLSGVMGALSLIRLDAEGQPVIMESVQMGETSARAMADLTRELMELSKGAVFRKETNSLTEIVKDITKSSLHGSNVAVEYDPPQDLWAVDVDAAQIGRVIRNIVINAMQAMAGGGQIEISAANVPSDGRDIEGNHVVLTIKDHGIGMTPDVAARVFDPFYSTKATGQGLGLATSYKIIEEHGGSISVTSKPGEGTEFTIHLPSAGEVAPVKTEEDEELIRGSGRVLVMDDDPKVLESAKALLEKLGYTYVGAKDGNKAIDLFQEARDAGIPFKFVIMDLTVPGGMGGEEAIQELRKIDSNVRAVVSSGYTTGAAMTRYKEHGFMARLPKPYVVTQLGQTLGELNPDEEPQE